MPCYGRHLKDGDNQRPLSHDLGMYPPEEEPEDLPKDPPENPPDEYPDEPPQDPPPEEYPEELGLKMMKEVVLLPE